MSATSGRPVALLVACAVFLAVPSLAAAAESPPGSDAGTRFLVQPYFLAPSMSGKAGVRSLDADVEQDAGDILGALDSGGMLYLELRAGDWAYALDNTYMNLGATGPTPLGEAEVDLRQTGIQALGFRRVAPWAEALLAVTYNRIEMGLTSTGPAAIDRSNTQEWVDPYVGLRLTAPGSSKWRFTFTGSYGGFGIGSDFAWQVFPEIGFRASRLFEIEGGYRAISMDYENGDPNDAFRYDVATFGPQLGARFHF